MAKLSRDKGARGELEVRDLFRAAGIKAERGQQHSGTPDSPDVKTGVDDMIHVEVKRVEALRLYPAVKKAREDAGPTQWPVVFHRKSGEGWVVIMQAKDWFELFNLKRGGIS